MKCKVILKLLCLCLRRTASNWLLLNFIIDKHFRILAILKALENVYFYACFLNIFH